MTRGSDEGEKKNSDAGGLPWRRSDSPPPRPIPIPPLPGRCHRVRPGARRRRPLRRPRRSTVAGWRRRLPARTHRGDALDWWRPCGLNPSAKSWSRRQFAWIVHGNLHRALASSSPWDCLRHHATAAGGRLGLDPASAWDALELGWSPSAHRSMRFAVRPWVELLASVGLQAFGLARARGGFRYHLWRVSPCPSLAPRSQAPPPTSRSSAPTKRRLARPSRGTAARRP